MCKLFFTINKQHLNQFSYVVTQGSSLKEKYMYNGYDLTSRLKTAKQLSKMKLSILFLQIIWFNIRNDILKITFHTIRT